MEEDGSEEGEGSEGIEEGEEEGSEGIEEEDQPLYDFASEYVKKFENSMDEESYTELVSVFQEAHGLCEEANELSKELRTDTGFIFTAQILGDTDDEESIPMEEKYTVIIRQFRSDAAHDNVDDDHAASFRRIGVFDVLDFKGRVEAMREIYETKSFLKSAAVHKRSHDPWAVVGYCELQQVVAEVAQNQWESMEKTVSSMNKSSSHESDDDGGNKKSKTAPVVPSELKQLVSEQKRRMSQLAEDMSKRRASTTEDDPRNDRVDRAWSFGGEDASVIKNLLISSDGDQKRSRFDTGHFGAGSDDEDVNLSDQESSKVKNLTEKSPKDILREMVEFRAQLAEQKHELLENDKDIETLLNGEGEMEEECEELRAELMVAGGAEYQGLRAEIAAQKDELTESREDIEALRNELAEAQEGKSPANSRSESKVDETQLLRAELTEAQDMSVTDLRDELEKLRGKLHEAQAGFLPSPTVVQDLQGARAALAEAEEVVTENAQDLDLVFQERTKIEVRCEEFHMELKELEEAAEFEDGQINMAKKLAQSGFIHDKLAAELTAAHAEQALQGKNLEQAEADVVAKLLDEESTLKEQYAHKESTLMEQYAEIHGALQKAELEGAGNAANSNQVLELGAQVDEALSEASTASSEAKSAHVACKNAKHEASEASRRFSVEEQCALTLREELEAALQAEAERSILAASKESEDVLQLRSDLRISLAEAREARQARSRAREELLRVQDELAMSAASSRATQKQLTEELFLKEIHVARLSGTEESLRTELNEALLNVKVVSRSAEDIVHHLEQNESVDLHDELNVALSKSSLHVGAYIRLDGGLREALADLQKSDCQSSLLSGVVHSLSQFRTEIRDSLDEILVAGLGGQLPGSDRIANAMLREELRTVVAEAGEEYVRQNDRTGVLAPTIPGPQACTLAASSLESQERPVSVQVLPTLPESRATGPHDASASALNDYENRCEWLPEFEEKATALLCSLRAQHVAAADGLRGVRAQVGRLRIQAQSAKSLSEATSGSMTQIV